MPTDDAAKTRWWHTPQGQRSMRAIALAVPVLLVNAVAFTGQYGYLKQHLPWIVPGIVMAALALESIAVYLQWHAHLAQLANDSALRLRLASYALALVIGAMNYSHYAAVSWRPTVPAVTLGLMSAISPWLWSIHSRRVSRDELMARGLVEEHAVRLGATRWLWHAYRSAKVMFRATWIGETSPQRAIDHFAAQWGSLVPPGQPGTLAHEELAQPPVRSIPVPHAVPVLVPAPVPAQSVPPAAVPAVHSASARLEAQPSLPKSVSQEAIDAAELALAGMAVDQLPSIRAVARDMLGDENQRRLAKKLLEGRKAAEVQRLPHAGAEIPRRPARAGTDNTIAWPSQFQPGGAQASG